MTLHDKGRIVFIEPPVPPAAGGDADEFQVREYLSLYTATPGRSCPRQPSLLERLRGAWRGLVCGWRWP